MKPTIFRHTRIALALLILVVTLGLVSWDIKRAGGQQRQNYTDTVPKTDKKIRDLDDVIDELNAIDLQEHMLKAQKEIAEAMKKIDGDKMRLEIEKAMREVDLSKLRKDIEESLSKVDMEKVKKELTEAMKDFDAAKVQRDLENSIAKVNWDKIKAELEKVEKIDMSQVRDEMKKVEEKLKDLGPQLEKEMDKARIEIEKAKVEIKEYKDFIDGLEKDGLLNKKESYTIKHKDGELTVNGKKASAEIYNKYRAFLEKHKAFTIEKSEDNFNIDNDD